MNISDTARVYCTSRTWLEGAALDQFKRVMNFEGILRGAAYPDLHPGRGIPVGAAFLTKDLIYPFLIGSDIGCGMSLFAADLPLRKWKTDRVIRSLGDDPETLIRKLSCRLLDQMEGSADDPACMLGTLGHGNHFAEILTLDHVEDEALWQKLNPDNARIFLLLHSGSRHYGERVWTAFAAEHADSGVPAESEDGKHYLAEHDRLVRWAHFNRKLIAKAFGSLISCEFTELANTVHNCISPAGNGCWLHRKGASEAETDRPLVIAGTRGSCSALVVPDGDPGEYLHSLAHGAGRKWTRLSTRTRMRDKYDVRTLLKTRIGSKVVCPDKNLLYEEAPDAYKNIEHVIGDLQSFGLIRVAARFKPLLNCKP